MEKSFKWNPGDLVWFMYNNKATCGNISRMWYRTSISCVDHETIFDVERYYVMTGGKDIPDSYTLDDLFSDKESLINSL